ncbi:armadillo-type protein [Obelidium mucronatum]|nr:armadillo-type protein [Obelidium mucronatum]
MTQPDPFAFESQSQSQSQASAKGDALLGVLNPAKPLATSELVQRLQVGGWVGGWVWVDESSGASELEPTNLETQTQKVHGFLRTQEQEAADTARLGATAASLLVVVGHRDKAVRALAACCLADVLRLFAPDAPYTEPELKTVFALFVAQLPGLADPHGPFFENYYYLLESLATVKSIILLTDLDADDLVTRLFKAIYTLVRPDFQKNVYGLLLLLLQYVIEESQTINSDIIEIIISQFDKPHNQMSRQLSIDLCNAVTDKLQRYICQYFGDLFYASMKNATSRNDDEDDDDEEDGGARVAHSEFQYAHRLILEMNNTCRNILLNVIPLFEDQLKCEDEKVRELSTDVLGKIFVDSGSRVAVVYPAIWRVWLERRNDKNSAIRILWLQYCHEVYRHHPELCPDISSGLEQKFYDPDDKVRLAAIKVMRMMDSVSLVNVSRELLLHLADRCKDKKMSVRVEAIQALSNIFKLTYSDIVSDENQAAEKYGWIPGCILELVYLGDLETGIVMERVLHEDIFVYTYDDMQRTDRLLRIVGNLTEKQYKAFMSVIDKQAAMLKDFMMYIRLCVEFNGGIMEKNDGAVEAKLNPLMMHISSKFPDSKKAMTGLQKFAKNNENRVYKLFTALMSESADFKTITKNSKEILKRLEPHAGLHEIFVVILRRVSLTIIGKSNIPRLIEVARVSSQRQNRSMEVSMADTTVDNDISRVAATAEALIKKLSSAFPGVYGSQLTEFLNLLRSNDESLVVETLEDLSRFMKIQTNSVVQLNSTEVQVVANFALHGTAQQGKQAGIILALLGDAEPRKKIIRQISAVLAKAGSATVVPKCIQEYEAFLEIQKQEDSPPEDSQLSFASHEMPFIKLPTWLATLSQFALYSRAEYEEIQSLVGDFIVKEVLSKNHVPSEDPHDGEDWIEWDSLHIEGYLKVLGVKVLVNRVRSFQDDENREAALHFGKPLYKLLNLIVEKEGEIVLGGRGGDVPTCNAFKSHLRQVAAISLLKLSKLSACDALMTVLDRNRLMLTIQDPCWQTRDAFVERLRKYLLKRVIPYRYIAILCMAALEPDEDIRVKAKTFLTRFAKAPRTDDASTLESIFVEVLYMVTHHPDFGTDEEDISLSAKYIQFYIDIVATADNVSFLFHSAAQLKTLRDSHAASSKDLYHISDLTQFLIQEHCKHHLWTLDSYPDVIPYKRELFSKIPSSKESNENIKISYLSKKWMESTQHANTAVKQKASSRRKSSLTKAERAKLISENDDDDDGDGQEETEMEDNGDDDDDDDEPKKKKTKAKRRRTSNESSTTTRKKSSASRGKKRKSDGSAGDEEEVIPRAKSTRRAKAVKSYTEKESQEESEDMDVDATETKNEEKNESEVDDDDDEEEVPLVRRVRKSTPAIDGVKSPAKSPVSAAKSPAKSPVPVSKSATKSPVSVSKSAAKSPASASKSHSVVPSNSDTNSSSQESKEAKAVKRSTRKR